MPSDPGQLQMDDPLAYFLTWTTYGTWLPGDERGWVAKPGQMQPPDAQRRQTAERLMTEPALTLDPAQRRLVEDKIADHCRIRGWYLHIVNVRTQHVHVVVTAPGYDPKVVMDELKAWCTRRLKEQDQVSRSRTGASRQKWWTQGGSKRWLNDATNLEEAVRYVADGQGDPTPRLSDGPAQPTQA
jgi:REP element-mobilizing transposase RayT